MGLAVISGHGWVLGSIHPGGLVGSLVQQMLAKGSNPPFGQQVSPYLASISSCKDDATALAVTVPLEGRF